MLSKVGRCIQSVFIDYFARFSIHPITTAAQLAMYVLRVWLWAPENVSIDMESHRFEATYYAIDDVGAVTECQRMQAVETAWKQIRSLQPLPDDALPYRLCPFMYTYHACPFQRDTSYTGPDERCPYHHNVQAVLSFLRETLPVVDVPTVHSASRRTPTF